MGTICSTLSGIVALKHPTLGVLVRDDGINQMNVPFMINPNDPIIVALRKRINAIAEICKSNIKPWEPDAGPRAVRLVNALARPYIDALCDYIASRPKPAFQVPWCNAVEDLVPVGEIENYLD